MSMTRVKEKDGWVCRFDKNMDSAACGDVEKELKLVFAECKQSDGKISPLTFDTRDVEYIASSFLRLCAMAVKTLGTDNVKVVNVKPMIKKVFMIAGFSELLRVE